MPTEYSTNFIYFYVLIISDEDFCENGTARQDLTEGDVAKAYTIYDSCSVL